MEDTKDRVKQVATDVGRTAKEHGREISGELGDQTRHLAGEVRQRLTEEAGTQNERLSSGLRHFSEDLGGMRTKVSEDSLAADVVQRLSEGSRRLADHLERNGPDGVMREVRDFARRRPGTFLVGAALAGFVVGRLAKGMLTGGTNGEASGAGDGSRPEAAEPFAAATATASAPDTGGDLPLPEPSPGSPAETSGWQRR